MRRAQPGKAGVHPKRDRGPPCRQFRSTRQTMVDGEITASTPRSHGVGDVRQARSGRMMPAFSASGCGHAEPMGELELAQAQQCCDLAQFPGRGSCRSHSAARFAATI
jgi:hypothetical protein